MAQDYHRIMEKKVTKQIALDLTAKWESQSSAVLASGIDACGAQSCFGKWRKTVAVIGNGFQIYLSVWKQKNYTNKS